MLAFDKYLIKPLEKTDIDPYYKMVERNRKRLEDFFTGTVSKTQDLDATKNFLEEISVRRDEKKYYPYIIIDKTSNEIVGFIDLKNIDWSIPKTEIGCYAEEKFAGRGIMRQALTLLIAHAFSEFNFRKIFLRTHHSNKDAIRLAEKCGFEVEGHIKMDYKTTSGEIVDLLYYGLINPGI